MTKQKPIIALLDDHTLFLKGMAFLLQDMYPGADIRTFQSVKGIMQRKYDFKDYDVFISDIDLPGENVFELLSYIKHHHESTPVLIVSMHKKLAVIRKAKKLGIEGYILKNEDELFPVAVNKILSGKDFYSQEVTYYYRMANLHSEALSPREEEILKRIALGFINKDISEALHISVETVKTHKKNIKLKLGLETTQQIIDYTKKNYLL